MALVHLKKLLLVTLLTSGALSSSAMASYISDGSSGIFHPLVDTTLDLSDPAVFPQFSNIYIDAGIRITVLSPGTGYGYLLSADGIYLNGILDAGTGSVSLNAANSIMMGVGSQLIGGNLAISSNNVTMQGEIKAPGGTIQITGGGVLTLGGTIDVTGGSALSVPVVLQPRPIINWQTFNVDGSSNATLSSGRDISLSQPSSRVGGSVNLIGGSISLRAPIQPYSGELIVSVDSMNLNGGTLFLAAPVPLPAASILLGSGLLGLLSLVAKRRRR